MKDKKEFGNFIKQKRIEKNFSQKDLAELLFVTESAVSKWERGVTYPDITLISDLSRVLDVTEHELIEASNDVEYREIKQSAKKYSNIKKFLFWFFNISYLVALTVCFIVNLATEGKLSWFFIVLASIVCGYTFVPTLTWLDKRFKLPIFIGSSFTGIFLLLLTISLYNYDYWFMIATMVVLLGYFIIFYPILFVRQKKYTVEENYKKLKKAFFLTYSVGILIHLILLLLFINFYSPYNFLLGLAISGGCMIIPILFGCLFYFDASKKIIMISLIILLGIVLLITLFALIESIILTQNTKENVYVIEEPFESINMNSSTYDINIYLSTDTENKLVCTENNKIKVDYYVSNGNLVIKSDEKYFTLINFGKNHKLDLYLTQDMIEDLIINQSTGNITIHNGLNIKDVDINCSTGDIYAEINVLNDFNIEVSTGNIVINNSLIKGNFKINAGTGDTKLVNTIVTNDFNFNGSTGDLKFDSFDAKNIYVEASTGNISGTLLSNKIFNCASSTGSVNVPETYEGGICKIRLSTGNINISYK